MDLIHNELRTTDTSNTTFTTAVITTTDPMQQQVNSSFCHIASLEVYRGRRQITEISHDGFSLSERGTVQVCLQDDCLISTLSTLLMLLQVFTSTLSYNVKEYEGELYRMNLSCSGAGLPQSGCLFFKVGGRTYVSNGKQKSR